MIYQNLSRYNTTGILSQKVEKYMCFTLAINVLICNKDKLIISEQFSLEVYHLQRLFKDYSSVLILSGLI